MKRRLLMAFLAATTVLGFAAGFHSLHRHHRDHDQLAQRLSRVCVDSALAAQGGDGQHEAAAAPAEAPRYLERVERDVQRRCAAEGRRHRR